MSTTPWYRKRLESPRRVDAAVRVAAASRGTKRSFARRSLLLNDLPADTVLVWITSGRVRLSVFDDDGAETVVAVLDPDAYFAPGPRDGDLVDLVAEAIEATEVIAFDAAAWESEPVASMFPRAVADGKTA